MTIYYNQFKKHYAELQHIKRTVKTKADLLEYLQNHHGPMSENLLPPHCILFVEELCKDGLITKTFKYNTVYFFALDDNLSSYGDENE